MTDRLVHARHRDGDDTLVHPWHARPLPEPNPEIDPTESVPDDPAELLPDASEPLSLPIESTSDDPGGVPKRA